MIDYFELYKEVLNTIDIDKPFDANKLFNVLSDKPIIKKLLMSDDSNLLPQATIEVIDNLINDGLIDANRISTKDGPVYRFKRVTTLGHSYLVTLHKPGFKEKLIDYVKSEGIPLSPSAITKFIARMYL